MFKTLHKYEDSSDAARGMIKSQSGLKATLRSVVKFTRSFYSHESTQEMLDEWRPMMCPFDRAMVQAMKYLSLFLPTTSSIPAEKGWKLWFDEFMTLWSSFTNSPSWETELFTLYTRLAFHNTGRINWTPYVEQFFTKFMVAFCLPVTYGQSGVKIKFGLSESGSFPFISRWIVSALGGPEGQLVQKHLDKMLLAIGNVQNFKKFDFVIFFLNCFSLQNLTTILPIPIKLQNLCIILFTNYAQVSFTVCIWSDTTRNGNPRLP